MKKKLGAVAVFLVAFVVALFAQAPNPANIIQKVDVITNLQQMSPASEKVVVLVLGTNTTWDGGAGYYRGDPTNELPHNPPNVITSSVTSTGRWVRITDLARLGMTNSVTNLVYITNAVVDVPEYYAMLSSYDEFGTYAEGDDFSSPTNNAHGWASAWEVASGSVYITNRWPTNHAPTTRTNPTDVYTYSPRAWMRSDSRAVLSGNNTELRRKFASIPSDWQKIRMAFRFTPLWQTNNTSSGQAVQSMSYTNDARLGFGFYNSTNGGYFDAGGYWVGSVLTLKSMTGKMQNTNVDEVASWDGGYLTPGSGVFTSLGGWNAFIVTNRNETLADLTYYDNGNTDWGDRAPVNISANWWAGNVFIIDIYPDWLDGTHNIQSSLYDAGSYENFEASWPISPDQGHILLAMEHTGFVRGQSEATSSDARLSMSSPWDDGSYLGGGSISYAGMLPREKFAGIDGVSLVWNNGDEIPLEVSEVMVRTFAPSLGSPLRVPTTFPTNISVGAPSGGSVSITWNNDYETPNVSLSTLLLLSYEGSDFCDCQRTYLPTTSPPLDRLACITRAANTATSSSFNSLQAGTWSLRLHYYSEGGLGPASATNTFVVPDAFIPYQEVAPVGSSDLADGNTSISISWDDQAGESGYYAQWKTNGSGVWNVFTNVTADVTNATLYGLTHPAKVTISVVATNGAATNASSSQVLMGTIGFKYWWDVDTTLYSDAGVTPAIVGDQVFQWTDRISSFSLLASNAPDTKPYYSTNGVGYLNDAGSSSNLTWYLQSEVSTNLSKTASIWIVAKENDSGENGIIFDGNLGTGNYRSWLRRTNSTEYTYKRRQNADGSGDAINIPAPAIGTHYVLGIDNSVDSFPDIRTNAAAFIENYFLPAYEWYGLMIGNGHESLTATNSQAFRGWIKGVVIADQTSSTISYNNSLSQKINDWLMNFYGVP